MPPATGGSSRLPIVGRAPRAATPATAIRASRSSRWRAAVLIGVNLLIVAHVLHWWLTGHTLTPLEPSEGMELGKRDVVNAGLLLFAAAGLATAVFGRFFCGWGCHLLALQDLCQAGLHRIGIRPQPLRSRWLLWVPTLAFVYMFLWPAVYRLATGLPFSTPRLQLTTNDFWATFPGIGVAIATFVVCCFVIVYLLGGKAFCTYACPYGALFGAADRLSPLRIRVTDACNGCGHCTAVCTSNVRVHEEVRDYGAVVDPGCMKCLDCVSVCPNDALHLGFGRPALLTSPRVATVARHRRLPWSEELLLSVVFALTFLAFRGLYGVFPFLFSLGIAACYAYLARLAWRLLFQPDVAFRHYRLQQAGELLPAGRVFVGVIATLVLVWLHCAVVQGELRLGSSYVDRLEPARQRVAQGLARPADLTPADRALAVQAARHLDRVRRWGALPTPGLLPSLAWSHYLAGEPAALALLAAVARADNDRQLAWLLLGRDAEEHGNETPAIAAYEAAIAAQPDAVDGYLALGTLHARAGRHDRAGEVFDRGRSRLPTSAILAYNAALSLAVRGSLEPAISLFRVALTLDPHLRPAAENLAGVLAESGRYAEAATEYRRAVELAPEDAELRARLAQVDKLAEPAVGLPPSK
jgi:tetratricopeptide (TPR) repeat protein/ferredoxin